LTLWQTKHVAKRLRGRTLAETCSNIWHFVFQHIQYKRDKDGVEQVRSPRRTWWERETGVDCDCYTEFISSILLNLNIPHVARMTKYPKRYPEVSRWQHVYPIVPKVELGNKSLTNRDDYIVLDCVKDNFDDEQSYLDCKDYDMKLDYLDGIEEKEGHDNNVDFIEPDSVDLADLAALYDDEEMGNIFKKIGSAVKNVAQKVGSAVKTVASDIKKTAPVLAKKVADDVGDGIRFVNRYLNPATLLLRNGFLLAMKINLFNVGGKLRYAYLTDSQAQAKGINISELNKLRTVKDRAETVYWQAGGKKENLKKAILSGKGNKDKKVPLSGFEGLDGLGNIYADHDEYNIIHSDGMDGLGEIASGTAIAAATSAVAAIAAALKQVKGLFTKGGSEEQAFQSETDNAGTAESAPATIPEDEDAFTYDDPAPSQVMPPTSFAPAPVETAKTNETQTNSSGATSAQPVLPTEYASDRRMPATTESATTSTAVQTQNPSQKVGFLQKTTNWVKQNPGKSLLVAGGIAFGGYMLVKAMQGSSHSSTNGLNGISKKSKKKRRSKKRNKVERQILL
jgi:hypothetical protein